jgi:hypothetical protein
VKRRLVKSTANAKILVQARASFTLTKTIKSIGSSGRINANRINKVSKLMLFENSKSSETTSLDVVRIYRYSNKRIRIEITRTARTTRI